MSVRAAIETNQGAVVDQLLQRELTVFPVHPVAAKSYRQRKAPSGNKTDHLDAWALADSAPMVMRGKSSIVSLDSNGSQPSGATKPAA